MTVRVFSLGASQLSAPINALLSAGKVKSAWALSKQRAVACYCTGDALQAIRMYRRQIQLSKGLQLYCGFGENADEATGHGPLDHTDITLMDCNTPLEVSLDGVFINRSLIATRLFQPLAAARPDLEDTYRMWWNKGVLEDDHEVRKSTSLAMIPALEGVVPYPDVAAAILAGARGMRQTEKDLVAALDELRRQIKGPFGMLTSTSRYLPDGRPVAWPAGHLEMTRAAARDLDIPLFDTVQLVQEHGVPTAMNEQMTVYRPEFHTVAGEAIHAFMEEVMGGRRVLKDRHYPIKAIRNRLRQHAKDLDGIEELEWLARVVDLCRREVASIPPLVESVEAVPEYIYPH